MKKLVKMRWILIAILFVSVLGIPQKVDAAPKKISAVKAYASFLKKNPSRYKEMGNDFYDASFAPEDTSYLDSFFLYDMDKNGVPELFTITYVNMRWEIIRIYTYQNKKVKLCKFSNGTDAVFNNSHTANGSFNFYICKKGHIHNQYIGGMSKQEVVYKVSKKKLKLLLTYEEVYVIDSITATKNGKRISAERYNHCIKDCTAKKLKLYRNDLRSQNKLKKNKCKAIK